MIRRARKNLPRFNPSWKPDDLRGKRVLVVGLGTFGGGLGATEFLLNRNADVVVTDLGCREDLQSSIDVLEGRPVEFVLGEHREQDVADADFIVASPAVPWNAPVIRWASDHEKPVETEISLLCRQLKSTWVGVTGTNGKSTVAMLLANALRDAGFPVIQGGNAGGSLLGALPEMPPDGIVVLELSSFQLEHMQEMELGPSVAVLTNITPDHLDRHKTFESYVRAKAAILDHAKVAVFNGDDRASSQLAGEFDRRKIWFGRESSRKSGQEGYWLGSQNAVVQAEGGTEQRFGIRSFPLAGAHNQVNLLAASAAASVFGATFERCLESGMGATPLPNRLNAVGQVSGVRFIDDSVSTSPPAVVAAINSFDCGIHLLVGGYDKGIATDQLQAEILGGVKHAYLYGAVGPDLLRQLEERSKRWMNEARQSDAPVCSFSAHPDLLTAFQAAVQGAQPGEVVLFSPGFASYDQFRNFAERGVLFRHLVEQLP